MLQNRLESLKSKILHTDFEKPNEVEIVKYELIPLITEYKSLKAEYSRRVKLYKELKDREGKLSNEEKVLWQSLHLKEFGLLEEPYEPSDSFSFSARTVCEDFMLLLEREGLKTPQKPTKSSVGRIPKARYLGNNRIKYRDNEYILPKNAQYPEVCQKLYEHCQEVGSSVHPSIIYNECFGRGREYNAAANWRWVCDMVGSLNRWAKRNRLPKLFHCGKQEITRLGTAKK